jgi:outer membrane immunogenic protein
MKKLLLAATAGFALAAGSASAADLGKPVYKAAPPPPPAYSWTGWYWGVNVGYSWGRERNDWTLDGFGIASESQKMDGVIGGFQSGFNWQSGIWVFGMESDFQATGQKGSTTYGIPAGINVVSEHKLPWLGTARSRIGVLPTQNVLLYATGGVAYGQVKSSYTLNAGAVQVAALNFKDTRAGWTAGVGVEGAFGGGWSAKLEYLYVDLGKNTFDFSVTGVGTVLSIDSRVTDNIVRVGLNYKWGDAPIVAKY